MMRCRPGTVPVCGGPGSAVHRSTSLRAAPHPGHTITSDAFVALFTFTFQTALLVPAAHFCARVLHRCFTHPESRGGRSAEKRSGAAAPVGRAMTRHARRLRGALRPIARQDARERAYDAGRSPLGAPPWRFWAPGAALPSPWAPAALQRRAVALRIRAASSSHPGRSAWRAGSLPPEANGYEPTRRRTPLPAPPSGSSPETPLNERGCGSPSMASICSQYINSNRDQNLTLETDPPLQAPSDGENRDSRSPGSRQHRNNR
jgi:hypothetical protein